VAITGRHERAVLAALAGWAGEAVSTDRLIDAVWGERPPRSCKKALQNAVMHLRKALAAEAIETLPSGYVLRADSDVVDVRWFERSVGEGRAHARLGDWAAAQASFAEALALWRGTPLVELGDWAPAVSERSRLEELHRTIDEEAMEAGLECGQHRELIADLERLAADEPLRERRSGLLMLGLYRSDRQADALRAFQTARSTLNELGLEPGTELRRLESAIAAQDPALSLGDLVDQAAERWHPRTFLLTDVVGSVGLWESDTDAMSVAVARHDALIVRGVTAAGGSVVRTKGEGDSTFSVFARPLDAVVAAVAIQRAVADESWPSSGPLEVRAGVHTGEAEGRAGDWYGPAVNRAARLRGLAGGAQTLVSGVTAGLVADKLPAGSRLVYRGRRVLRGIERPEEVWELGSVDDPRFAVPTTRPVGSSALPTPLTRLVGRSADLTRLGQLLDAYRLVTLTGPGGSGKTRIAVELAHRLAGQGVGVWYAGLAPLRDSEPLVDVVATALGAESGPDRVAMLQRRAEQLHGVLVLDNCEHLLDECGSLVERLLVSGPELRVLATSRESLGLDGEQVWPVAPLGIPAESVRNRRQLATVQAHQLESVELLVDRARALRPDLDIGDDEVASLVRICRALDGIPLAIELAACRLRSLSFQTLADRLDDQVRVLARSRPSGPSNQRHQSLRVALDWSYDLLTGDEQRLARGLSVFSGGFRLGAVDGVLGHHGDPLDGIDALVAKSLVTFDSSTARYHLLEPIRQYLSQRLEAAGEVDEMRQAHADWVAMLCARLGRRLLEDLRTIGSRLDEERSNIDLALRWGCEHDIAVAARIVGALGQYWFSYDQASGRRWCERVLAASTGLDDRTRSRVLVPAGIVAQNDKDWDQSVRHLRATLAVFRAKHVPTNQAMSLF
jgi:predicted ATPase/class 3 adenylate cyclase